MGILHRMFRLGVSLVVISMCHKEEGAQTGAKKEKKKKKKKIITQFEIQFQNSSQRQKKLFSGYTYNHHHYLHPPYSIYQPNPIRLGPVCFTHDCNISHIYSTYLF